MSTSYMNYAERLNLPLSPQSPSTPGTPSTVPNSFAPSPSQYKAYSPYTTSLPPFSPQSLQSSQSYAPHGGSAPANKKNDVQRYAPYVPPTLKLENLFVPLDSNSNASYPSPVSPNNQSFASNSPSTSISPLPDAQIIAPYLPPSPVNNKSPTPPASQPCAPRVSPASANDWRSAPGAPTTPVNNQPIIQSYASSVSSTPLYKKASIHSTSSASAPYVSSPLRDSNVSSGTVHSQAHIAYPTAFNSPSSTSYKTQNSAYAKPPSSTPTPPGTRNVPSPPMNEELPLSPTSQPKASYVSSSPGESQSYATHAPLGPAYSQSDFPYHAPSPVHEQPLNLTTLQSSVSYNLSAPMINRPSIQSGSSAPVINQPNVSFIASDPLKDKIPISSVSSSSIPHMPPPPLNTEPNSSHTASVQDQIYYSISSSSLPGTQNGSPALANTQPIANSGSSIPTSYQSNPSYAASIPLDNKLPLLHLLRRLRPHLRRTHLRMHDPPPMNQTFEPASQPNQGFGSPTNQFLYTPKVTPTSGMVPTIPVYDPQRMNQAYVPVDSSPSLAFPPGKRGLYTPEPTSTGVSTPRFPLPPGAASATERETKSSWGKRFVGNILVTRGIRAGVTSVASSVKLPAMLSPWGDNNPATLPNVRRRDAILLAGSHFGAEAVVSGSLTFAGGLLVDVVRCLSEQAVDQAILDRIQFDEAKILRTTSVKSLQITIKHQLMGVDADLRFFGERSAPLTLLSCAKGWFCPYLYSSGRTPSVPRSQNFAVAQCFGPFLNADSALAHKVLAEGVATMSLCNPDPAHTPVNGHYRLIVLFAGISPWRTQAWSQARIPGQAKLMLHLINGCPALVIPVLAGGGAQGTLGQGAPICAWSAWTLAQMTSNMEYAPERHYEELFRFLESMMSVPDVESRIQGGGSGGWRNALARGLQMMIKAVVATKDIADPKVLSMIDPERAGIVMFRY
ncbi:hypothetical protein MMC29_002994 [Sticta canariensis]|nr:hypothetical protein [Sticta canariensis]